MVKIFFFSISGNRNLPTNISVNAACNSYAAMAIPERKAEPDIPMNCSADMFAAINDAPTAHQVNVLPAKK